MLFRSNLDIFNNQNEKPYTPDGSVNLAHLLVGSEGTLALTKSLKLRLSELPRTKVLGVVNFPTFYNASTGVLTLSGAASLADYRTALRSVTYSNSSEDPSTAARTVSFQVDDGSGVNNLSNVATSDVTVTPVNDAPVTTEIGRASCRERV